MMFKWLRELIRWFKYYRHDEYVRVKDEWLTNTRGRY